MKMIWGDFIRGILFLSLIGPGIAANVLVFVGHLNTFVSGPERNPIDLLIIHLVFANALTICATGSKDLAAIFHLGNVLGDLGCKLVLYLGRAARGLSICTTCLLSGVQAITISPRNSSWRKLKPRSAWQVLPYLFLFWVVNFLISSNLLFLMTSVYSMNTSGISSLIGYCHMLQTGKIIQWLFITLMALRDIFFQSVMGWSSGYIAFRLYKHHKCALYLRNSRYQENLSPELRAARSVLILMTCYLFFYWLDFIFALYLGSSLTTNYIIFTIKMFLTVGYASLSPLLLITRNPGMAKVCGDH